MKSANCINCNENFQITKNDEHFYLKIKVPAPRRCPKCRFIRRLLDRKCSNCGKQIETTYAQEITTPIYCEQCYLSVIK